MARRATPHATTHAIMIQERSLKDAELVRTARAPPACKHGLFPKWSARSVLTLRRGRSAQGMDFTTTRLMPLLYPLPSQSLAQQPPWLQSATVIRLERALQALIAGKNRQIGPMFAQVHAPLAALVQVMGRGIAQSLLLPRNDHLIFSE
jgi:hypothetical protein